MAFMLYYCMWFHSFFTQYTTGMKHRQERKDNRLIFLRIAEENNRQVLELIVRPTQLKARARHLGCEQARLGWPPL